MKIHVIRTVLHPTAIPEHRANPPWVIHEKVGHVENFIPGQDPAGLYGVVLRHFAHRVVAAIFIE
tara:strand:- start:3 stop:197 length:195 start_codon:yes stop_codon:yes gene_type:complete